MLLREKSKLQSENADMIKKYTDAFCTIEELRN